MYFRPPCIRLGLHRARPEGWAFIGLMLHVVCRQALVDDR